MHSDLNSRQLQCTSRAPGMTKATIYTLTILRIKLQTFFGLERLAPQALSLFHSVDIPIPYAAPRRKHIRSWFVPEFNIRDILELDVFRECLMPFSLCPASLGNEDDFEVFNIFGRRVIAYMYDPPPVIFRFAGAGKPSW